MTTELKRLFKRMKDKRRYISSSEMRGAPCPKCGKVLDAYTKVSSDRMSGGPKDGTLTICAYCATPLCFVAPTTTWGTMNFRLATDEDIAPLKDLPEWQMMVELATKNAARRKR